MRNNMLKYLELIKHLTLREIKGRYKQSFLGFFWIILNPFFQMVIMSFVFSTIMKQQGLGIPYPIFLYAGLLPWLFFSNSLGSAMNSLTSNSSLVKKIYFPREILVLATLVAKVFDFILAFIIFAILMLVFKINLSWYMLLYIPIFFLQFFFTYGLSLLLSALNLFYRDVQYLFDLVLTLWFYLTPVIYATEFFPEKYRFIFKLNPMSVFINAYRQVLFKGDFPKWESLVVGLLISLGLYLVSHRLFKKMEGTFADVV
ncbi:ABC transporter [Candidatus Roizmanbacteria bacterium CG22_combo_CG10-13_8_21_14_all_35_9]|uniref:Transport permease protein n=2 Tax=Candidatus Roizmaniibacteriota TaxID=1752723 RepID=A0A2H0C015_9BACT|nr:MAG: ABC transporter [Candidatus Roizmanbacteria bacterium CG22_combo_CG10-13_8_21_14_all_35_9]PIY70983.1 MAG: ABC transporter permease [Candidatus Roizmanbacteria bacterium CG_4_10_14_0_8_um_filter_35_28]